MEKKKCKDACSKDRGKSGKVKMATETRLMLSMEVRISEVKGIS